jgi:hypothetical protein
MQVDRIEGVKRQGRCYQLAGMGLLRRRSEDLVLVHGTVQANGPG